MSRSCQSAWFSIATAAYPRKSRAKPAMRSLFTGFRFWGMAELPAWPARNGSRSSSISLCCRLRISVAKRSSVPPVIAMAATSAACRSRWTTCVLTGSTRSSSAVSASRSIWGLIWLYVPTGPEIFPVATSSAARARRSRSRAASKAQPASFAPSVIGSACMEWVRPAITVSRSSRARRMMTAMSASSSTRMRSLAARSCRASAVSMTSLLVKP